MGGYGWTLRQCLFCELRGIFSVSLGLRCCLCSKIGILVSSHSFISFFLCNGETLGWRKYGWEPDYG